MYISIPERGEAIAVFKVAQVTTAMILILLFFPVFFMPCTRFPFFYIDLFSMETNYLMLKNFYTLILDFSKDKPGRCQYIPDPFKRILQVVHAEN